MDFKLAPEQEAFRKEVAEFLEKESPKEWHERRVSFFDYSSQENWIQIYREMCEKNGIIPVEFDGKKDAKFHPYNIEGKRHIEYLGDVGHYYDDVPLEQLWTAVTDAHGPEFLDPLPR